MSNPLLDAALAYRAQGLKPIPLRPRSKQPLVGWKAYQTEAPTEYELRTWWAIEPNANVGLVMGGGMFAVDVDSKVGSDALLERGIGSDLAFAPLSKTPRGSHYFLAGDEADRVALLPSVDIRGVGYVVAPPSVTEFGSYEWIRPIGETWPFPQPSGALRALLAKQVAPAGSNSQSGTDWLTAALSGVAEGGRDATCTRLAGRLLGVGLPQEAVDVILQRWALECDPPFPADQVSKCVNSIAQREGPADGPPQPLADAIAAVLSGKAEKRPAAATGIKSLDDLLDGGFRPGELIYLGARPSVGKSALALHIGRTLAAKTGVLYVSREMALAALVRRMLSQVSEIPLSDLKRNVLSKTQQDVLTFCAGVLSPLQMWLTTSVRNTAQLDAALTEYTPGQLGLVIVDYLQIFKPADAMRDTRARVEATSGELKDLAVKYDLPFLVLSSLSRPPKASPNWRPEMASLRESGELEHDGDNIILLHRDEGSSVLELHLAKQKDGPTGHLTLTFNGPTVSFK